MCTLSNILTSLLQLLINYVTYSMRAHAVYIRTLAWSFMMAVRGERTNGELAGSRKSRTQQVRLRNTMFSHSITKASRPRKTTAIYYLHLFRL